MSTPLTTIVRTAVTYGQCETTKPGSIDIPIDTKNMPEKMSRSEMTSPGIR